MFELSFKDGSWSERMIYSMCTSDGCPDGNAPTSGVIMDAAGNLYGVSQAFDSAKGTAFELTPNARHTKWKLKVLMQFCADLDCKNGSIGNGLTYAGQASGALYDGTSPLYGTAQSGGTNNGGVAFSLTPPPPGQKKWKQKIIHNFCMVNGCTKDGNTPAAGMILDAEGNLYGTASQGGPHSRGVVFELNFNGRKWQERILYDFCCGGGSVRAPLIMDAAGDLLGTTDVVFKLTSNGGNWDYSTLYTFCSQSNCADGDFSDEALILDGAGNIYGDTFGGGSFDGGVVFALEPGYTILHTFCPDVSCKDGKTPSSPLLLDPSGNLFGATLSFGAHGAGNIFEIMP